MSSCSAKVRSITYTGMTPMLTAADVPDQGVSIRIPGRLGPVGRTGLPQNGAHVVGHRVAADRQLEADLAVAAAQRDEAQDVDLAPRQVVGWRARPVEAAAEGAR